jgi:hypothetical protein
MNFDVMLASFLSTQQAVLPSAFAQYWGLYSAWALVLAWGASALTGRWPSHLRWGVVAVVGLLTLIPGPTSPAYWLGLAFQSPSVTSVLLAVWGLSLIARARSSNGSSGWGISGLAACAVGAGLGWVLLLDTLAWWPVSVYAWGFSPAAVGGLALSLVTFWGLWGESYRGRIKHLVFGVPAMVLIIFVATRWPTGNVWDALLDPWLWVAFHLVLLISGLRAWRQRGLPTIRA